jgi:hypothetical protein
VPAHPSNVEVDLSSGVRQKWRFIDLISFESGRILSNCWKNGPESPNLNMEQGQRQENEEFLSKWKLMENSIQERIDDIARYASDYAYCRSPNGGGCRGVRRSWMC